MMINILLPIAGKTQFFPESEYSFPRLLTEIANKTVIERVVENMSTTQDYIQFIFIVSKIECKKFNLNDTLNIITDHKCKVIQLDNNTKGAACSALMAINHVYNDNQLIIANSDQLFDDPVSDFLSDLKNFDAGVITFESVHPRWSYVKLDEEGLVVETAEKRPISREAIAGFYYFRHGKYFINAAMQSIRKRSSVNGTYYIAPTLNELILDGKKVGARKVNSSRYHTLYSPQKIKEYEAKLFQQTLQCNLGVET